MANKIFSKRVIASLAVFAILIVVSLILDFNDSTGAVAKEISETESISETEALAKCLTEKGVYIYVSPSCGHCNHQKEVFGDDFQYINSIDCTEDQEVCKAAGIAGVPTWVINNQNYPGRKSLSELKELTNC